MKKPARPPSKDYLRANVVRTTDFVRKTWRHREAPVAIQHSRCRLAGGLPDTFRVLRRHGEVMVIASRHRTLRAAINAARRLAKEMKDGHHNA